MNCPLVNNDQRTLEKNDPAIALNMLYVKKININRACI